MFCGVFKQLFISERFFLYYSDLTGIEITIKEKHIYSHKVSLNVTSVGSSDKLTYRSKTRWKFVISYVSRCN